MCASASAAVLHEWMIDSGLGLLIAPQHPWFRGVSIGVVVKVQVCQIGVGGYRIHGVVTVVILVTMVTTIAVLHTYGASHRALESHLADLLMRHCAQIGDADDPELVMTHSALRPEAARCIA